MAHQDPDKIKLAELMLVGMNWEEATRQAGVVTSRSGAYWFLDAYLSRRAKVLEEHRPLEEVLAAMVAQYKTVAGTP